MADRTVKRRIFASNTRMVLVMLFIWFVINALFIKGYWEYVENQVMNSASTIVDGELLEEIIEDITIRRNEFLWLFLADVILCFVVLAIVSRIFTRNLTERIMEPLNALADGAARVRNNELTQRIDYEGELEFENVCNTFNDMQYHLFSEQEKNRKYEMARTDMIAGISHDLRTPLTAVRGTLKGLLDGVATKPEQQNRFLETAYRRSGEMEVLLNRLFYLSKLETGNMPIVMQDVEIAAFIHSYVENKQELLKGEPLTIIADTAEITVHLSVDPEELVRVFDNLLENSRKYGHVDCLQIKIALSRTTRGICICFSDNGVGVPEEKLPFLFDEFYRVDESRNEKEGNGLGLYIVKYLIEAMNGSVRAENKGGLSIYMELPVGKQE